MSFCIKCGNKLSEGVKFCEHCGAPVLEMTPPQPSFTAQQSTQTTPLQTAAYTQNAQQGNAPQYHQPYAQRPGFIGVPPYQSAPVFHAMQAPDYDKCVECARITDVVSAVLLLAAILIALFVHAYVGIVLCLVAELVALIPNTKLQNAFKRYNMNLDRHAAKEQEKQLRRELKNRSLPYRLSWLLAIVAMVSMIIFLILANVMEI